jgi:hypothetical protein
MLRPLLATLLFCSPVAAAAADPALFVYKGAGCDGRDRIARFESVMGVKVAGAVDFLSQEGWPQMSSGARWAIDCWSKTPIQLAISVPMLMKGETSFANGNAGANDAAFTEVARLLVAKGKPDAYVRIGWEFNGDWYPWQIKKDVPGFKAYFRRIVGLFRAVPGQRFRIVWNPSMAAGTVDAETAWPGDDVVDVVGLDAYNQSWRPQDADPLTRWNGHLASFYGLNWLSDFAVRHGKPIALPEWATGTRPDGHGWGDDPLFIHNMAAFMRGRNTLFAGYWDFNASDYNGQLSTDLFPASKAAFTQEFAPR